MHPIGPRGISYMSLHQRPLLQTPAYDLLWGVWLPVPPEDPTLMCLQTQAGPPETVNVTKYNIMVLESHPDLPIKGLTGAPLRVYVASSHMLKDHMGYT
eukprot:3242594-Pleurochrysis_carterae.AAC.1